MSKKAKDKKQKTKISQSVSLGNSISDSETYNETIDIREKRIGIVFKVIYVIALFFATVFFDIGTAFEKGVTHVYIIKSGTAAFLLVMLFYMVGYIINEMKCLKLNTDDLPQRQINITEKSYSNIFMCLCCSGITTISCIICGMYIQACLSDSIVLSVFIFSFMEWIFSLVLQKLLENDNKIIFEYLCCISATIMLVCLFIFPATNVVPEIT